MLSLFYVDIHHGAAMPPLWDGDVMIHGDKFALDLNHAFYEYASYRKAGTAIPGGDESVHNLDPVIHFNRAYTISQNTINLSEAANIALHRAIGNHEIMARLKELGLTPESYISALNNLTSLIVCQPTQNTDNIYSYDNTAIEQLIATKNLTQNLILTQHWPIDRLERGLSPVFTSKNGSYGFEDKLESLLLPLSVLADGLSLIHI